MVRAKSKKPLISYGHGNYIYGLRRLAESPLKFAFQKDISNLNNLKGKEGLKQNANHETGNSESSTCSRID